jgi:ubiquinone/menaquinone biosynthesis C-methylase UbiE
MPFRDACFDVVVSVNTLHVIDDPVAMLDEIERVLAPDGILLISDIKRSWLSLFKPALKMAYTPAEVEQFLEHSRLRSCRFHNHLLWFALEAVGSNGAGPATVAGGNGQSRSV